MQYDIQYNIIIQYDIQFNIILEYNIQGQENIIVTKWLRNKIISDVNLYRIILSYPILYPIFSKLTYILLFIVAQNNIMLNEGWVKFIIIIIFLRKFIKRSALRETNFVYYSTLKKQAWAELAPYNKVVWYVVGYEFLLLAMLHSNDLAGAQKQTFTENVVGWVGIGKIKSI